MTQINDAAQPSFFSTTQETVVGAAKWCGKQVSIVFNTFVDAIVNVWQAIRPFLASTANFVVENTARSFELLKENKEMVGVGAVILGVGAVLGVGVYRAFSGQQA